jgi:hypothetical protein
MGRVSVGLAALLLCGACDDDGGSSENTTAGPGTTSTAGTTSSGSGSSSSGAPATTTTSGGDESSSSSGLAESSTGAAESSTGDPNACNPQIPGEFNACIDADGDIDNTLCNWMGTGGGNGFIGCLTSSTTKGANVCMISDCEEVCDCFAAPATGTATVECAEVLAGGGRACVLTCADGQTCPDGMSCEGGLCFHLPPE